MYFRNFVIYLSLEKGGVRHLNKLKFPSLKDVLCLVWLTLAQWFRRKRLLNFGNAFSLFLYLPLEMGGALSLNKLEYTLPKDALC